MATVGSTFQSSEPLLNEVLDDVAKGVLQLPDFQRGWVWDDDHIRSLIASVSLSYPIGAIMVLETGGSGVRFKPRLVEGVQLPDPPEPGELILDGQQRLTSLYLAMRSGCPVPTRTEKNQAIDRVYYLDMERCLDAESDRFDAVVSLPADRIARSDFGRKVDRDLSTAEREYELAHLPLTLMLDSPAFFEWRSGFQKHFLYAPAKTQFLDSFQQEVWQRFQQYKVPVIRLLKGTSKEAVCQVFEKVNTGGVTLSVFELVTASFAADDFQLRTDWEAREQRLHQEPVLGDTDSTAFLTAVTLSCSYQRHRRDDREVVGCKRRDVLRLSLEDYRQYADGIEQGFARAAKFLVKQKVMDAMSLPYSTQLIPLAAICASLGARFEEEPVRQKLARWYWCGVFGELYGGAHETRMALDLPQVITWIDGGEEPRTVRDCAFVPTRLLTLQTRRSAAYKGLLARLIAAGSKDFLSGDSIDLNLYFDEAVDIHHIFPRSWCLIPSVANSRTLRHPATSGSSRVPAPVPAGR